MTEERYQQYQALVRKQAWRWHLKTGMEYEELMAEGNLVFCQACQNYQPHQSNFCTYLHNSLQWHFGNLMTRHENIAATEYDCAKDGHNGGDPERQVIFKDLLARLPQDAQDMINAVLETPMELAEMAIQGNGKINQKTLQRYFRQAKGWSIHRVWQAIPHIQQMLRELGLRQKPERQPNYGKV